jgi:hypothetical protein
MRREMKREGNGCSRRLAIDNRTLKGDDNIICDAGALCRE